jgi:hypothetical protein
MLLPVKLRYDFCIGGRDVGDFVSEDDGAELRQWVRFEPEEGGRFENRYAVRYAEGRPLAYRVGDGDWVDLSELPDDHYPTAAYPLLLRHGVRAYAAIDEGTGEVRSRTLERRGDRVVEREGAETVRAFTLRGGLVVAIDWGGATSALREDAASPG